MPTTAGTIEHRTKTSKPNRASSDVSRNAWDDSEIVTGGTDGDVFSRDSAKTDGWGWTTLPAPPGAGTSLQLAKLGVGVAVDAHALLKVAGQMGSTLYDAGNSGASKTLDWDNGNSQYLILTGNAVLTLNNPISGFRYAIYFNTGAGGFTPVFPGSWLWFDAAPTLPTTAGKLYLAVAVYLGPVSKYAANFSKEP